MNADLRKAALLLSSLPDTDAKGLLTQLDPVSATAVQAAVKKLGVVEPTERIAIVEAMHQATGSQASRPFAFLESIELGELHALLCEEHPQCLAAVVSQLPRGIAIAFLRKLSAAQRQMVIVRIAALQPIDAEILRELAHALMHRWGMTSRDRLSRAG
jgi:flagellar motor switch protein FliG